MPEMKLINSETRISELIKANPVVIDTLVELNPNFSKLRNPILRNLLARRVSISDACAIAGCKLSDFLDKMISIGFETDGQADTSLYKNGDHTTVAMFTGGLKVVVLDVRPVLTAGDDPLKLILKTCKALKDYECLKIINTFEPIPLVNLLAKQGYRSWSERPDKDTVYTWFVKWRIKPDMTSIDRERGSEKRFRLKAGIGLGEAEAGLMNTTLEFEQMIEFFGPERIRTIDVRDLEMPKPMIRILDILSDLNKDEALFVYHKKLPVFLLPELEDRGFRYFIENRPAGQINMLICKI